VAENPRRKTKSHRIVVQRKDIIEKRVTPLSQVQTTSQRSYAHFAFASAER
jgi:hypothetical protein